MLEIFALPYFVVSGVIGWAIFTPFFRANDSELSSVSVAISDLLALPLPVSFVLLTSRWAIPAGSRSPMVQVFVLVSALVFAAMTLAASLFLVPQKFPISFLKRVITVGIIAPFGILLTIGWIGVLVWACVYSIVYLVPVMGLIALVTFGLRLLSLWACRPE